MVETSHVDTFARDNLPPRELWPDFLSNQHTSTYPERMNCVVEFLDRWIERGHGDAPLFRGARETLTYADFHERVNRVANVLVQRFGLVPGGRVMLRAANTPTMVAAYFAVMKAGGIVVATMPLLRASELAFMLDKARIPLALYDVRLEDEMLKAQSLAAGPTTLLAFNSDAPDALEALMRDASPEFQAIDTAADDVCLIGFTSGTTGTPKGTMHFHRDMLAICDGYSAHILQPRADDTFIGTAPLAFTFGLGGLVLFPMRVGASAVLVERATPEELLAEIERHRPTICFTAPTAYRAMLRHLEKADISSLRKCVSAGESLPAATWHAWFDATGLKLMDGIGATELLHIFISAREDDIRPGATGKPVPGYEARVIDADGRELPPGQVGRLAVRGPVGCRYLADERQRAYISDGWNVTGDAYVQDADGYFWYQARTDDMIISSGYNIAGPEVEAALMLHDAVFECGVVGAPDPERTQLVKAYVVLNPGYAADEATARVLQDHVKAVIAPYKYPRAVEFVTHLPRTESGKLRRASLRAQAAST